MYIRVPYLWIHNTVGMLIGEKYTSAFKYKWNLSQNFNKDFNTNFINE